MSECAHFAVFGFVSTHDALAAESLLLDAGEDVVLIPTPRTLGSLCGFAVRVPLVKREHSLGLLEGAGIVPSAAIEMTDRV